MRRLLLVLPVLAAVAACQQTSEDGTVPGTSPQGFTDIAEDETIYFGGTEPFWGGEVSGAELVYSTPENPDGTAIEVERFTGQGGLGFSGTLGQRNLDMTVTPGACSDGMSDRSYPYIVILQIGDEQRAGCAHTDRQPYTGQVSP